MELSQLTAISPIDGRYGAKTDALRPIFSEYGLIRHRVVVEVRWLQALAAHEGVSEVPALGGHAGNVLNDIIEKFSEQDAQRVKNIESTTNHDVKAVEYFLKEKITGNAELEAIDIKSAKMCLERSKARGDSECTTNCVDIVDSLFSCSPGSISSSGTKNMIMAMR